MKDAEIKALQTQINPHFIYTTLEAINWKAKLNGVNEISNMISSLSFIIDANLNRDNEKFVPIHKEIEYINNYNFLIQKRFGDKIIYPGTVNYFS
jgi:two-component system, sensor histidine kinase YesM